MGIGPATKEDYLELWRSIFPEFYTEPIETEADGRGFDVPSAQAAMVAAFERSANLSHQSYYLKPHSIQTESVARGPRKASGTVLVRRQAPNLGDVLLVAGTRLRAEMMSSYGDQLFLGHCLTTADVTLPEGDGSTFEVPVEAEFQGYSGNLEFPGLIVGVEPQGRASVPSIVAFSTSSVTRIVRRVSASEQTQWDHFTDGMVGRYVRVVQVSESLATADVSAVPRRITGTWVNGEEVGILVSPPLDPADDNKTMLVEVEELADLGVVVSQPGLVIGGRSDALGAIAADRGQGRVVGETDDQFAERLCNLSDVVSPAAIVRIIDGILTPLGIPWRFKETGDPETLMGFTWDVHPWDFGGLPEIVKPPGSELVGQGIVWLDYDTFRRFFIICVGRRGIGDFGFGYDYTTHPPGTPNAWDVGFYDGRPLGWSAALGALWEAVDQARAGGVGFVIMVDPSL